MKKYQYIIYVVVVVIIVAAISIVFNFFSRPTFSELESRELSKRPEFSLHALFSGKYTQELSSWYSDSEPYRDLFMTLSMEFDNAKRLNIKNEEEVAFIAGDDDSEEVNDIDVDATTTDEKSDSIPAKPNVEEKAKISNHGIVLVGSEPNVRALMAYRGGPKACNTYAKIANRYQDELGENVQVYCLLIPTAVEFYCPEKAKSRMKSQRETIDNAYSLLDSCVVSIDAYSALARHTDEDIFLRTDHHWAPLGAYYAAEAIAKAAGVPFKSLDNYDRKVIKQYVGSMYRYSKDISVRRSPEDFVYYTPRDIAYKTTYINYIVDENYQITGQTAPMAGEFFFSFKDGSGNAYCTFMGSDNKITQIRTATENSRRVVLIKDSYGNAIPGYLFYSFEEIHVIDARYFNENIKRYVAKHKITDLILGNNIAFATSATTLNSYISFLTNR